MATLADFEAFAAIAGARSFRRAAALRGVSASALSEAMRRLEARLGVRLLNRTTRSVTPTEAGERLLQRLLPALSEVTAAVETLGDYRSGANGTIRLNVPGVVARVILPAIAARFLAAHPGITLEVMGDDSVIDVFAAGFDAGVRYDSRLEKDMIAVPLGPRTQRFVTAAAKAYLDANGTPCHPHDLLHHACIRHRFPSGVIVPWEFERGKESLKVAVRGPLVATNMEMEVEAAGQGLGIVHTFEEFLAPMLANKSLKAVLEDWSPRFSGPSLYYRGGPHVPLPLRTFVEFLRQEAKRSRARIAAA